jgi:uncharacterized protein (DUF1499 family)
VVNYLRVFIREFSVNPSSNSLESDRPQHGRPNACVAAQQDSSATFDSLHFHSCKDMSETSFQNVIISFFLTFLELQKPEPA